MELGRRAGEQRGASQHPEGAPEPVTDRTRPPVALQTPLRRGDVICPLEEHERFLGYIESLALMLAESRDTEVLGDDFWSTVCGQTSNAKREFKKLSAAIEQCDDAVVLAIAAKLSAIDVADAKREVETLST